MSPAVFLRRDDIVEQQQQEQQELNRRAEGRNKRRGGPVFFSFPLSVVTVENGKGEGELDVTFQRAFHPFGGGVVEAKDGREGRISGWSAR